MADHVNLTPPSTNKGSHGKAKMNRKRPSGLLCDWGSLALIWDRFF
jgi:hypothetical protein